MVVESERVLSARRRLANHCYHGVALREKRDGYWIQVAYLECTPFLVRLGALIASGLDLLFADIAIQSVV